MVGGYVRGEPGPSRSYLLAHGMRGRFVWGEEATGQLRLVRERGRPGRREVSSHSRELWEASGLARVPTCRAKKRPGEQQCQ